MEQSLHIGVAPKKKTQINEYIKQLSKGNFNPELMEEAISERVKNLETARFNLKPLYRIKLLPSKENELVSNLRPDILYLFIKNNSIHVIINQK